MKNQIQKITQRHKNGEHTGIYSICSANRYVIEASIRQAKADNSIILIESTSNQVNQFGGYTGMTPKKFMNFIYGIAKRFGFPAGRIIFGGDHIGPNAWKNEKSENAMLNARNLVYKYAESGYKKIHLDASTPCKDDPKNQPLSPEIIAERSAELCKSSEEAALKKFGKNNLPIYVIGTDVPPPGGALEKLSTSHITSKSEVKQTIEITKKAFISNNLESAWERVIAVVVQPGVEFDNSSIIEYNHKKAEKLSKFIESYDTLVYEAHSTDYQTETALCRMVQDHFAILKVGPALTFAFREAVFALAKIEQEWLLKNNTINVSNIIDTIEKEMLANPKYWKPYYTGSSASLSFSRKYSFSDRIRYYWPNPVIKKALDKLIKNLSKKPIPLSLLSQYMPMQYYKIREGELINTPTELITDKIMEVTGIYSFAAGMKKQ
ncbi:D-tagatose-bisphosphate aldolase, class II, non-catalytic subunit [bacterium]|nr:D-tagatose-bisphosphate aldolase, class II, non-catalytic subunit [bacterium]